MTPGGLDPFVVVALAAVVGVAGIMVVDAVIRRPLVAVVLTLIVTVSSGAFVDGVGVDVASFRIADADVVFVVILVAGIARLVRLEWRQPLHWMIVALCLLACISVVRGVPEHGIQTAVNEFRRWLYFFSPALYFSTIDIRSMMPRPLTPAWIAGALAMGVVVLLRWAHNFLGVPLGPLEADFGTPLRAVDGAQTYFMAEAFLLTLPVWTARIAEKTALRWTSAVLGAMVILLNRRTVWVSLFVGFVVLVIRDRNLGRRVVAALVVGTVITVGGLLSLPEDPGTGQGAPVAEPATDTGTFAWRIEGWRVLLEDQDDAVDWLFGQAEGSGFERRVEGRTVVQNPHNFYIEILLSQGILGLGLFLAMIAMMLSALSRTSRAAPRGDATTLLVLLSAQLVWWLTWGPGLEQGLLFGVFASAAITPAGLRRAQATGPDPDVPPDAGQAVTASSSS